MKEKIREELEKEYVNLQEKYNSERIIYDAEFSVREFYKISGEIAGFEKCLKILGYEISGGKIKERERQ